MRIRALVPVALAALLVAGCTTPKPSTSTSATPALTDNGVSALSAGDILAKAKAALASASSVHVRGTADVADKKAKLDLTFKGKSDVAGTIQFDGQKVEIIRIGTDVYLKADASFWKSVAGDQVAPLLQGKYVRAPNSNPTYTQYVTMLDAAYPLTPVGTLSKGTSTSVNGVNAIGIVDDDPKLGRTVYVATQGQPYPLRIESTTDGGALDYVDYNKSVDVKAPPASQVLDLSQFPVK